MTVRRSALELVLVLASAMPTAACGSEGRGPVAAADAPAVVTDAVDSAPPETSAPEMSAPETSAPETSAPETSVAQTVASTTSPSTTLLPTIAPTTTVAEISPFLSAFCPTTPHAATVDRDRQRAWLCEDGRAVHEFAFTGAVTQPDPGTYPVYAKDLEALSTFGRRTSFMTHFVAFTYGKYQGARVAFHSMPTYRDGAYVQPLESVGEPSMRGQSAGCLRVSPEDAVTVWDWLAIGDEVRVIN